MFLLHILNLSFLLQLVGFVFEIGKIFCILRNLLKFKILFIQCRTVECYIVFFIA